MMKWNIRKVTALEQKKKKKGKITALSRVKQPEVVNIGVKLL